MSDGQEAAVPEALAALARLAPAAWRLEITSTEILAPQPGVDAVGATMVATLSLRRYDPIERQLISSRLGRPFSAAIYGWLDADSLDAELFRVGIVRDGTAPDPRSHDPYRPGVLGDAFGSEPVLTIGALTNIVTEGWLDGFGIGLFIAEVTENGFSGMWKEVGLATIGRGTFVARLIERQP